MAKKGVSMYVSWVIVVAMVVGLSFLMYDWTISQVKGSAGSLERTTDDTLCQSVSFSIDGICQNTQILYINMTNNNNIKIDTLQFRLIDLYGNSETKEEKISLYPGDREEGFSILKQGTLINIRIVPIITKDDKEIICQQSSIEKENILQC